MSIRNQVAIGLFIEQIRTPLSNISVSHFCFVLILFEIISLKWMKSLTNSCWLEASLSPDRIQDSQDLLAMLANHLLSIVRGLKKSKEPVIYNISIRTN